MAPHFSSCLSWKQTESCTNCLLIYCKNMKRKLLWNLHSDVTLITMKSLIFERTCLLLSSLKGLISKQMPMSLLSPWPIPADTNQMRREGQQIRKLSRALRMMSPPSRPKQQCWSATHQHNQYFGNSHCQYPYDIFFSKYCQGAIKVI